MYHTIASRTLKQLTLIGGLTMVVAACGCGTQMEKQPEQSIETPAAVAAAPAPLPPILLLSQTRQCTPVMRGRRQVGCGMELFFNPNQAGSTITVEVAANLTDSRPSFQVADANNNLVANEPLPVSNKVIQTFTSQNTTSHRVAIKEMINFNSFYTVTVTEQHPLQGG